MDNKHIEDILRQSWSPEPPDRLREKVLRSSMEPASRIRRWKLAFVGLGVAVVILANTLDYARGNRLTALINNIRSSMSQQDLCDLKSQVARMRSFMTQEEENGGNPL